VRNEKLLVSFDFTVFDRNAFQMDAKETMNVFDGLLKLQNCKKKFRYRTFNLIVSIA
jgi:hypothetical protein